jgi:hypothetical protein
VTEELQIGDYVEVDIGMGLGAYGIIVTEHATGFRNDGLYNSLDVMRRSSGTKTFKIEFFDESTHTAYPEECRKLTDKELFKIKLNNDKTIHEI